VLVEPAAGLVVRIQPREPFPVGPLLGPAMRQPMLQTFASSCSFCASAMTFWATCVGTSS
jgi:hypothetical protein